MNEIFKTQETTFTDLEGNEITVREHNGADEEILATVTKAKTFDNIPEYLSRVIVITSIPGQPHPTIEDIKNWRVATKYYCLFKSRMFSLGDQMKFKYTFDEKVGPVSMNQDLNEFDNVKPLPFPGQKQRTLELQSGKQVRYSFLNTHGEKYAMEIGKDKISMATISMRQRALEWFNGKEWIVVSDFSIFTSRDTQQIRSDISSIDKDFYPMVEILEPGTNKVLDSVPLLLMDAFFWPEEIL
jgi:hypothetical protein